MSRRLLWPLMPLYAAAVAAKNTAHDREWLKPSRLQGKVISVGNLSTGGSGKTPFVIALADLLIRHGRNVDVLSRGYGRSSAATERVDPHGNAERFGDEPLLIAQSANVPVYVGTSRYAAGLLAEKELPAPCIHLLDDGFQHRKLARDVDICLVHRDDFEETLLPSGNLREPRSAFRRASVFVVRESDIDFAEKLRALGMKQPVWRIERRIELPENVGKAVAFCGIAHPDDFFSMLRAHGADLVAAHAFRDHHAYTDADMQQVIASAQQHRVKQFLTTEKDFVRLSAAHRAKLNSIAPVRVVALRVQLLDEAGILRQLYDWVRPSM